MRSYSLIGLSASFFVFVLGIQLPLYGATPKPTKCQSTVSSKKTVEEPTVQLSEIQFHEKKIEILGRQYQSYNSVKLQDSDGINKMKTQIFFSEAYHSLFKMLGIEFVSRYRMAYQQRGSVAKLMVQEFQRDWSFNKSKDLKREEQIKKYFYIAMAFKAFLTDFDISKPNVFFQSGRLYAQIFGFKISDPSMSKEFNKNEFLTFLDRHEIGAEHYPDVLKAFELFNEQEFFRLAEKLEIPSDLALRLTERKKAAVDALKTEIEIYFRPTQKLKDQILKSIERGASHNKGEVMGILRQRFKQRLDNDIRANTSFKSFEEYKRYIESIPEYRKLVKDIQQNTILSIHRHRVRRSYILLSGFRNLFETGTSSISQESAYSDSRLAVESQGLGMSAAEYNMKVPPLYRAKSAFVLDVSQIQGGQSRYGSDNYFISLKQLMEQEDSPLVTMTIGDSLDDSFRWYSRPVLAEDFAYLAAPFVYDARQRTQSRTLGSIDYRGPDPFYKFSEVRPHFLGDLDKKFNVYMRKDFNEFSEPLELPMIYTEAQIYGFIGIDSVNTIAIEKRDSVPTPLLKLYQELGIKVIRYKATE